MDNGLIKTKVVGDIKFTVQYKPVDYIVLSQIGSRTITQAMFDSVKKDYSGLQYFDLTIDPATGNENILKYKTSGISDYGDNLAYYSFGMRQDLKLADGGTLLPCVLYNFDNSHDLSKHSTAVFGFENLSKSQNGDKVVQYNAERLGLGFVKLGINASDINRIPKLNLSEL